MRENGQADNFDGTQRAFDITEALHYRMIPFAMRHTVASADPIPPELQDEIAGRLYPSLRAEAVVCYQGSGQRGIVAFKDQRWHYVPERNARSLLTHLAGDLYDELWRALETYNPLREVIIIHFCADWFSAVLARESTGSKWLGHRPFAER